MIAVLRRFPLLVILSLIASTGMVFPALHAVRLEDLHLAGIFAFHGLVWTGLAIMIGIASSAQKRTIDPPRQVVLLLIAYFALPVILAAPLNAAVPAITFQQAYFEMLSCLTTTGATIFDIPGNLACTCGAA
jgi:trk/ktr system potassium uptake protein